MRKTLDKLNLIELDTHGLKFDFKEYEVVDFTGLEEGQILYKNKYVHITAEKNLQEILHKGYGVFYDGKVYYEVNLAPEIINKQKKNLEHYISEMLRLRQVDRFGIQKYLTSPDYEVVVNNAIMFYDRNFDIEFVKRKLNGRVKNVDTFIKYLESRNIKSAS